MVTAVSLVACSLVDKVSACAPQAVVAFTGKDKSLPPGLTHTSQQPFLRCSKHTHRFVYLLYHTSSSKMLAKKISLVLLMLSQAFVPDHVS